MGEQASYLTQVALQAVTEYGTAKVLSNTFTPGLLAGKTGTSNELRDSWFAGFDGRDAVGIWVGFDNNQSSKLTGASGALPLFADYFAMRRPTPLPKTLPAGVELAYLSHHSGFPVASRCDDARLVPAITAGLKPRKRCQATERTLPSGVAQSGEGSSKQGRGLGGWLKGLFQ